MQVNKKLRIILDTNIWISFLITKDYSKLDKLIDKEQIRLIFSTELIDEFIQVTKRPKLNKFFKIEEIEYLIQIFNDYGDLIQVKSKIQKCRDKNDDFLLSLAVDSSADYLVTGDDDLLSIGKIENTEIITIKGLVKKI